MKLGQIAIAVVPFHRAAVGSHAAFLAVVDQWRAGQGERRRRRRSQGWLAAFAEIPAFVVVFDISEVYR